MSSSLPAFVLGFHGCRSDVAEAVLGGEPMRRSENGYDWLGHGMYFWEHNERRARVWAEKHHPEAASVIGAVIDLGWCLDLLDAEHLETVHKAYLNLAAAAKDSGMALPENTRRVEEQPDPMMEGSAKDSKPSSGGGKHSLVRRLDCAVINSLLHEFEPEERTGDSNPEPKPYQSVRAMFQEGTPLYPGAGFSSRNHIQVCVRDTRCIRGFFRPLDPDAPAA